MLLLYCKSLCVPKEHPNIALELTTIFYTHYTIVICLIIVVLLTVLFNVKCLLMLNANMLLSKTVKSLHIYFVEINNFYDYLIYL